jgi:hypothetical protein
MRAPTCSILEKEERADDAGGTDPTGKGAARRSDGTSGADAKREDSRRGSEATTTRWRPGFLDPAPKLGATTALRLHDHTSELKYVSS